MKLARSKYLFPIALAVVMIGGGVFSGGKVHQIRKMQAEITQLERTLSAGQDLWRRFPPFQAGEQRALERSHERLLNRLPEGKAIPRLLEEVSRVAQEHHLSDFSLKTDEPKISDSTTVGGAIVVPPPVSATLPESPVASVPFQASFYGDYREIAYFLDAIEDLPRLLKVETVGIRRDIPLVQGEVTWKAYHRNGLHEEIGK